jgi:hypothetical protein
MATNEDLTGIETWHLIAPLLVPYMENEQEFSTWGKAYVKIFCALKYWDENHKGEAENGNNNR